MLQRPEPFPVNKQASDLGPAQFDLSSLGTNDISRLGASSLHSKSEKMPDIRQLDHWANNPYQQYPISANSSIGKQVLSTHVNTPSRKLRPRPPVSPIRSQINDIGPAQFNFSSMGNSVSTLGSSSLHSKTEKMPNVRQRDHWANNPYQQYPISANSSIGKQVLSTHVNTPSRKLRPRPPVSPIRSQINDIGPAQFNLPSKIFKQYHNMKNEKISSPESSVTRTVSCTSERLYSPSSLPSLHEWIQDVEKKEKMIRNEIENQTKNVHISTEHKSLVSIWLSTHNGPSHLARRLTSRHPEKCRGGVHPTFSSAAVKNPRSNAAIASCATFYLQQKEEKDRDLLD